MRRFAVLGCALAILALPLSPVAAQEIALGYNFLSNDSLAINSNSLPWGINFGTAMDISDNLAIAVDISANYKFGISPSDSFDGVVPALDQDFQGYSFNRPETDWCSAVVTQCDVRTNVTTAMIGPRFYFGGGDGARPFVHVLGGVSRSLKKVGTFFNFTSTNFAVQPGVGVDVPVNDRVGVRFQVDYRRVFFGENDQIGANATLASAGGQDYSDFSVGFGFVFNFRNN